jgi:beta-galactosidase
VIDLCRRHGIKVILGTPTYCAPAWVSHQYPEVLRWNVERQPMRHGSRRNLNYTSPKYLELSDRICAALADHYKDDEQVIGWQLDNEFNCHMDVSYAPCDTAAFRAWLKERYRSIERLNQAWGTAFWSQTYDAWEQVDLPGPTPTYANPHQLLDETRFISDCVVRFAKRQADILRARNSKWLITHNGLFSNVKGTDLAGALDFFSHDQYPLFYSDWTQYAANLAQARSLSFPYGIMEQQAGPGGQMAYLLRTPRPGEMRLWAWQSVAHGAKAVVYFRWRTCPYGSEQHWHGILDADDRDNRRLEEAEQTGEEMRQPPAEFFDTPVDRAAAVLRDFDNEANDRRINTYNKEGHWEAHRWLAEFARRHVPADMVWPESDWSGYRLIIAPHLRLMTAALAKKLRAFVEGGGTLVVGAQTGIKNELGHVVDVTPPGLIRSLAGVEVEDFTTLEPGQTRSAQFGGGETVVFNTVVERLRLSSADVVASWADDDPLLAGAPAVTRHRSGRGETWYVAGYAPDAAVTSLAERILSQTGIAPVVDAPPEVEVIARGRYLCLLNHSAKAQRVDDIGDGRELIEGASVDDTLELQAYGVAIIRRDE